MKKLNITILYLAIFAAAVLLLSACSKEKIDARAGNLLTYNSIASSSTRIISLDGSLDVKMNNTKLTNWMFPSTLGVDPLPQATTWFPSTGKFKGAYYLPQQLLNGSGEATLSFYSLQAGGVTTLVDTFKVQDNYKQPWDYYLAGSYNVPNDNFVRVPRSITTPTDPSHIRIRLLNLAIPGLPGTAAAKVSLAYADGSAVSTVTSGITSLNQSDYVELPYGTYQFKVLVDGTTIQLPAKPPMLTSVSSFTDFSLGASQVYYAPVQTYQPGGVYTIAVGNTSGYQYSDAALPTNTFTVITDIAPQANVVYSRLQVINAAAENGIKVQIDGGTASRLAYASASDYATLIKGKHTVTITDAAGSKLAEQSLSTNGGDNLSVWAYQAATGGTAVTVVQNNMSGVRNTVSNTDGSDAALGVLNPLNFTMLLQTRFLNLCPDLPYVTFTNANGALFANGDLSTATAAQNLQPGKPVDAAYPYVNLGYVTGGTVQAYQSSPQVLPGNRLTGTAPLSPADFVRMSSKYFNNGKYGSEPGVYTVALIGRSNGSSQPKLIVIKHNR